MTVMMTFRRTCLFLLCLLLAPAAGRAQSVFIHDQISFIDLGLDATNPTNPDITVKIFNGSTNQTFTPIFDSGVGRWVFDHPAGARFLVQNPHLYLRPGGGAWNFIGVGPNQPFRATPQNGDANNYLVLSISSVEFPSGVFVNDEINVFLSTAGTNNPGHFSLYTNDDSFNDATGDLNTIYLSTLNNLTSFSRLAGTENNFNLAFSAAGTYQLDFQFSGTLRPQFGGGSVVSDVYRYTFVIAAIPEPATWALMGLTAAATAAGVVAYRRRKRRLANADLPVQAD